MLFPVRKILTVVEEIHHDLGPAPETPAVKGAVAAVVGNPYVGRWVEDLSPAVDELRALGEHLDRPVDKLNIAALGNVTPQLHIHVIGRRRDDPVWPDPVWGRGTPQPWGEALPGIMDALRDHLA